VDASPRHTLRTATKGRRTPRHRPAAQCPADRRRGRSHRGSRRARAARNHTRI